LNISGHNFAPGFTYVAISKCPTTSIALNISYGLKEGYYCYLVPILYRSGIRTSKEAVDVTNHIDKQEATLLYQEARKTPKSIKDFHKWIDN
jgi:hypothetical protein